MERFPSYPTAYETATAPPSRGLRHALEVFSRRKLAFGITFLVVVALGLAGTRFLKPVYRVTSKVLVPTPPSPRTGRGLEATPVTDIEIVAAARPASLEAQADEMSSEWFLNQARKRARVPVKPGKPGPQVKVTAPEFTNGDTLEIAVEGGNPREVTRLANTIARMHVDQTNQVQSQGIRKAVQYVRRERDLAARRLAAVNSEWRQFRAQYPVQQWTDEQATRAKQLADLRTQLLAARSRVASIEQQVRELRPRVKSAPALVPSNQVQDNPERIQTETRLRALRQERLDMLREFQPASPEVHALDEQISAVTRELKNMPATIAVKTQVPNAESQVLAPKLAELEAALVAARQDFLALNREFRAKDRPLEDLGPLRLKQDTLQQEQTRLTQRYQALSDQYRDLALRQTATVESARVVSAAILPTSPSAPSKPLLFAVIFLGATVLGVAIVLLMEMLDDRVHDPEELEHAFALPLLGRVPKLSSGGAATAALTDLTAMDAYRTLRAGVQFTDVDHPIRLLQVTSSLPGEGKSQTAINLALALAMDGKRVVLVDCDLRAPQLATALCLPTGAGLSECLARPALLAGALQEIGVENLQVLPAGAIPPNPPELLGSERFRNLLTQLAAQSDIVVLDSPPCLPAPDSVLLSSRVDGVLVVVEADRSRKAELAETLDLLDRANARVIGGVYNRAPAERGARRYYGSRRQRRTPQPLPGLRLPGMTSGSGENGTVSTPTRSAMSEATGPAE